MINAVTVQGRLVKDLELKTTAGGSTVGNFSLACERSMKNANGVREADFIQCSAFGKTAETIAKYVHKGYLIIVSGRLQTSSYEKDGQKHYSYSVLVSEIGFCDNKASSTPPQNTVTETPAASIAPDMDTRPTPPPMDLSDLPFDI